MKQIIKREIISNAPLQVRERDGEQSRSIAGYAILFNTPSAVLYDDHECTVREVISPDAVSKKFLDASDIKMTMFHDRQLILARSNKGNGTLSYGIDEKGVYFEFEAPHTADGDKALELVKRGDISGCSFAFSTYYYNDEYVARSEVEVGGKVEVTCTVNRMIGIYDMTLASDPAYPETECWARELMKHNEEVHEQPNPTPKENAQVKAQIEEMRQAYSLEL